MGGGGGGISTIMIKDFVFLNGRIITVIIIMVIVNVLNIDILTAVNNAYSNNDFAHETLLGTAGMDFASIHTRFHEFTLTAIAKKKREFS